jgi:hypothetical protein
MKNLEPWLLPLALQDHDDEVGEPLDHRPRRLPERCLRILSLTQSASYLFEELRPVITDRGLPTLQCQ